MKVSATLAMNNLMKERIKQGLETYKLGFGQSPFPVPKVLVEQLRESAWIKDYLSTQGLIELRTEIAAYYKTKQNLDLNPDQIIVGPGSKELLFLTQMTLKRDLLLPAPSWVTYAPQAELLNHPIHWIQTKKSDDYMLTPSGLEEYLEKHTNRKFVLVLNYPNNPTGKTFDENQMQMIAEIAKKHDVKILSDEIYGAFAFDTPHQSIYKYYPEGTFIYNGLSKWCGAGGWRLAFMICPKGDDTIKGKILQAGSETYSCASAPLQYASIEAFKNLNKIDVYTENCKKILMKIKKYLVANLDPNKVELTIPDGGFYSFINFKGQHDATGKDLCLRLLNETGVAVIPGSAFGRPEDEHSARLAFVDLDGDLIYNEAFMSNIENADFETYFPQLSTAVKKLNAFQSQGVRLGAT